MLWKPHDRYRCGTADKKTGPNPLNHPENDYRGKAPAKEGHQDCSKKHQKVRGDRISGIAVLVDQGASCHRCKEAYQCKGAHHEPCCLSHCHTVRLGNKAHHGRRRYHDDRGNERGHGIGDHDKPSVFGIQLRIFHLRPPRFFTCYRSSSTYRIPW